MSAQLVIPFVTANTELIDYMVANNLYSQVNFEQFMLDNMETAILTKKLFISPPLPDKDGFIPADVSFDKVSLEQTIETKILDNYDDILPKTIEEAKQLISDTFNRQVIDVVSNNLQDQTTSDEEVPNVKETFLEFLEKMTVMSDHANHFIQAGMLRSNFDRWIKQNKLGLPLPLEKELVVWATEFFKSGKLIKGKEFHLDASDYATLTKVPFPEGEKEATVHVNTGFSGCMFLEPYNSFDKPRSRPSKTKKRKTEEE